MEKKVKKTTTNPKAANQYLLDVRQDKCWELFLNPKSETYGNAYRSAIKAGYAPTTAKCITHEDWWQEKTRRMNLLSKAEKVLEHTITMETNLPVIGMFGPIVDKKTKQPLLKEDANLLKIRQDSAKFVAERLGKKKGYSTRTELTGEDGAPLPTPILGSIIAKKDEQDKGTN